MAIKELKSLTFGDGDTYVPAPTAWNEIPGNPFGGGRNSISWASAGLDFNTLEPWNWYKVSNAVVTMEDFADVTDDDHFITWISPLDTYVDIYTSENVGNARSLIYEDGNGNVCICIVDGNGNTYDGVQFRPDGVYFYTDVDLVNYFGAAPISVTVPGFGKFESSTIIDSKYLPEGIRTETIARSDTVMIDGLYDENWKLDVSKFAGKEMLDGCIKVSSASIYAKSFDFDPYSNGYYLGDGTDDYGISHVYTAREIKDGFYRVMDTDENGNIVDAGFCAADGSGYDPGLYLDADVGKSFTFFHGAIFETRTPKPIDKKYLPDDIGGMPEVTAEDNGKFLRVVDGAWAAVSVPNAEGVGF